MKRIGYNSLAFLATLALVGLASTAIAATPTPNGIYAPAGYQRYFNDYPQAAITFTNNYPASIFWGYNCPGALNGWAEKGVWELSADGGATKLLFPNFCNYSFESDFTLFPGTNVAHSEGGLQVSPWWNDDGGEFMVNPSTGEIVEFGGLIPSFSFSAAYSLTYVAGAPIHEKVKYLAGAAEPSASSPATVELSIIYGGLPYSSGVIACGPANPFDPPHGTYGQLDDTKLGGTVMGGPIMPAAGGDGSGTLSGLFGNIQFTNLDALATPARTATWGAMKSLYR